MRTYFCNKNQKCYEWIKENNNKSKQNRGAPLLPSLDNIHCPGEWITFLGVALGEPKYVLSKVGNKGALLFCFVLICVFVSMQKIVCFVLQICSKNMASLEEVIIT